MTTGNRELIRDAIVAKLKELQRPADTLKTVSTVYQEFDKVPDGDLPYIQVIPSTDTREPVPTMKESNVWFPLELWIYTKDADEVEYWIEEVRKKLYESRTFDLQYVLNHDIVSVESDDIGFCSPRGVAIITDVVKFRSIDR